MSYCPATMCPLIAPDGSPWTGTKNTSCPQLSSGCLWFDDRRGQCDGCNMAHEQIASAAEGKPIRVAGPNQPKRTDARASRDYDCPRASECQWQIEADKDGGLCPPRSALRLGLDPRLALY
jgi:hypothetical protein